MTLARAPTSLGGDREHPGYVLANYQQARCVPTRARPVRPSSHNGLRR